MTRMSPWNKPCAHRHQRLDAIFASRDLLTIPKGVLCLVDDLTDHTLIAMHRLHVRVPEHHDRYLFHHYIDHLGKGKSFLFSSAIFASMALVLKANINTSPILNKYVAPLSKFPLYQPSWRLRDEEPGDKGKTTEDSHSKLIFKIQ